MREKPAKIYIPAVDGMRALGVLAVLFYHLHLNFAKCGLLGVTVFFVISGYLVTWIMLRELNQNGTLDVKNFWKRRLLRILPNMIFMILVMGLVFSLFNHFLLDKMRPDILPSVLLVNNWWQIFHEVSYFEAAGAPSPLTHCWSLGIEGQFYLLWPLLLLLLYRLPKKRNMAALATLLLAVLSIILMAVTYDPLVDPSRTYYGTDTRCFSLLLGAFLALSEPKARKLVSHNLPIGQRLIAWKPNVALRLSEVPMSDVAGAASLLIILCCMTFVSSYSPFLYYGGQALVSVATMLLLLCAINHRSLWSRFFSLRPLVGIGKMSYSLYLWHYPVILLISGGRVASWRITLLEIILSFATAGIAYFVVERPFRRGLISDLYQNLLGHRRDGSEPPGHTETIRSLPAVMLMIVLLTVSGLSLAMTPSGGKMPQTLAQKDYAKHPSKQAVQDEGNQFGSKNSKIIGKKRDAALKTAVKNLDILAIGDSVIIDATKPLKETFKHIIVDAKIGRHAEKAAGIYDKYVKDGWDGDVVIYSLATNGPLRDNLAVIRKKIGEDTPLFIINARAPYDPWSVDNNKIIKTFCKEHPHTYEVDWYGYSAGHEEYFEPDGTHLVPKGQKAYRDLIYKTMLDTFRTKEYKLLEKK